MPENGKQPGPQAERAAAVWRPEDAANFLSAAIKEAQRPLTETLKKQGVPGWAFGLVVLVSVAAATFVWLHFDAQSRLDRVDRQRQLQDVRREAETIVGNMRDSANKLEATNAQLTKKLEQAQAEGAAAALAAANSRGELEATKRRMDDALQAALASDRQAADLQSRYDADKQRLSDAIALLKKENEDLMVKQVTTESNEEYRQSEAELKARRDKTAAEGAAGELKDKLAKAEAEAETLRKQIEGLEEENQGLRKQVEAARKLLSQIKQNADAALEPAPAK